MFLKNQTEKLLKSFFQKSSTEERPKVKSEELNEKKQTQTFYDNFFSKGEISHLTITSSEPAQETNQNKSYTLYLIRIQTDQLSYILKRRYNHFYTFNQSLYKKYSIWFEMPSKTYLLYGTNEAVVRDRIPALNRWMERLLETKQTKPEIYIEFLKFLELEEQYNSQNNRVFHFSTFERNKNLSQELMCLNKYPQMAIKIVENIELVLLEAKKKKIRSDEIREVLMGINQYKGIVQLCFSVDNQLTQLQILQTIAKITKPHACELSETITNYLRLLPEEYFKLNKPEFLENRNFKNAYFEILQTYLEKSNFAMSKILNQSQIKSFQNWLDQLEKKKIRQKMPYFISKSSETQKRKLLIDKKLSFQSSQHEQHCQKFDRIISDENFQCELKELFVKNLNSFFKAHLYSSTEENLLKLQCFGQGTEVSSLIEILRSQSWNPFLLCSKQDKITNFTRQTFQVPQKQEKILLFKKNSFSSLNERKGSLETNDDNGHEDQKQQFHFWITKIPAKVPNGKEKSHRSYFQKSELKAFEKGIKVQIWIYFHEQTLKNYFKSEIIGNTSYIWHKFCAELQNAFKNY